MAFVQTGIWETCQVAIRTAGPARMLSVSRAAAANSGLRVWAALLRLRKARELELFETMSFIVEAWRKKRRKKPRLQAGP